MYQYNLVVVISILSRDITINPLHTVHFRVIHGAKRTNIILKYRTTVPVRVQSSSSCMIEKSESLLLGNS